MEGEKQFDEQLETNAPEVNENYDFTGNYVDKRTPKEKLVMGAILIAAVFAIILGYYQISTAMKRPFAYLLEYQQDKDCIGGDCKLQADILAVLEQQQTDTDGDGLSDYDEVNTYGTSPYLEDSDSDGFNDKQEIDAGHDPNCAGTDNCFRTDVIGINSNFNTVDAQALLSGNSNPQSLRNLLAQRGFSQDVLDSISDQQLMLVYQQALSGQTPDFNSVNGNGATQTNTTPNNSLDLSQLNISSVDDLKGLTGAQIRALMVAEGAPADLLSQISDDQLKSMFLTQLESKAN